MNSIASIFQINLLRFKLLVFTFRFSRALIIQGNSVRQCVKDIKTYISMQMQGMKNYFDKLSKQKK